MVQLDREKNRPCAWIWCRSSTDGRGPGKAPGFSAWNQPAHPSPTAPPGPRTGCPATLAAVRRAAWGQGCDTAPGSPAPRGWGRRPPKGHPPPPALRGDTPFGGSILGQKKIGCFAPRKTKHKPWPKKTASGGGGSSRPAPQLPPPPKPNPCLGYLQEAPAPGDGPPGGAAALPPPPTADV